MSSTESADGRAIELFDEFVEMTARERAAALARLEKRDPELHRALRSLLQADAEPDSGFENCIKAAITVLGAGDDGEPDSDARVGALVDVWRITGIIGRGGMGTVYRAERADGQFQQTVALKYIRDEIASPRLVQAFVNERNVLARFGHPDIVPLLDGGVDDDGRPWYAMQLVDGLPIDRWCDERALGVRERVALFVRACEPIAHAHRNAVLHQDIKPSNVLVTPDGRPRLLDFGLSVLMADPGGDGRRIAMTSGYTPPEALQGARAGVHTDIYALGVMLYRLVCGRYPAQPYAASHRPRKPSELVARLGSEDSRVRGCASARALARELRGDLDRIAMRCVATAPQDRYPSVEALQRDLEAWLDGRPVFSGDGGRLQWAVACLRARWRLLAAAAAAALLLVAVLFGWELWRGEREAAVASEADRFFESALGMAALSGLGDVPLTPVMLLERAERQLRQQAADRDDPATLVRGLSVLARNWALVGDYPKAEALALEARRATPARDSLQSAFNHAALARIQNLQARHREAESTALGGLDALSFRLTPQHRLADVRLRAQLAAAQSGQGRSQEAFATLDGAISEAGKLSPELGSDVIAELLVQRGVWLRWRMRMQESEADLLRAIDLTEGRNPVLADDARESLVRTVRASRRPGREERALKLARQLLGNRQATMGANHPQTGMAWAELAFMQMLGADFEGARRSADEAETIMAGSLGPEHPAVARAYMAKGHLAAHARDVERALEYTGRARRIYELHYGPDSEFTLESRFLLGSHYWARGNRDGSDEDIARARDLIGEAIEASVRTHGDVSAHHRGGHALLLIATGRKDEAAREIERAKRDAERQFGAESQDAMMVRLSECSFLIRHGEDDAYTERALASLAEDAAATGTLFADGILHSVLGMQAGWLSERSRHDQALAAARLRRQVVERMKKPEWLPEADALIRSLEDAERSGD